MPADDHEMVLPCASVIVIIVLLNEAFTWATPDTMFLRSRRRTRCASLAMSFRSFWRARDARRWGWRWSGRRERWPKERGPPGPQDREPGSQPLVKSGPEARAPGRASLKARGPVNWIPFPA